MKTYYTIYKTTNLITGEFYIGQHQTTNVNDKYLGSGSRLKRSILKYGIQSFKKEILHVYDSFDKMNAKEREIVTEEFIRQPNVLNVILGGNQYPTKGTTVVAYKDAEPKYYFRIPVEEYDETIYITPSTGRLSVLNLLSGETESISKDDFDSKIHKPVAGGIVVNIDGKNQYVTKQFFKDNMCNGIHKGKITVVDLHDNCRKHVTKQELQQNPARYIHNTEGFVTGRHKLTGEKKRFKKEESHLYKNEYTFSTTGYVTVFDSEQNKFVNIPKEKYNSSIHHKSQDKKFTWHFSDGTLICEYWGGKYEFLKKYGVSEAFWYSLFNKKPLKKYLNNNAKYKSTYIIEKQWKPNNTLTH